MNFWYKPRTLKKNSRLTDYLDNRLDKDETLAFEKDILSDEKLCSRISELKSLTSSLHELSRVKTSPAFDAVLRARIRHEVKDRPLVRLPLGVRAAAFASAAVLFVVIGFLAGKQTSMQNTRATMQQATFETPLTPLIIDREQPAHEVKNYVLEHVIGSEPLVESDLAAERNRLNQNRVDTVRIPIQAAEEPFTLNQASFAVQF